MAAQFGSTGVYYKSNTGLTSTSTTTACMWMRIDTDRNDYSGIWELWGSGHIGQLTDADGTSMRSQVDSNDANMANFTASTWYFICLAKNGTSLTNYWGTAAAGVLSSSTDSGLTSNPAAASQLDIGSWSNFSVPSISSAAWFRLWYSTLTAGEVDAEYRSATAVKSGANREYRFESGSLTTDSGGSGYTLTATGTPTFTADPTLPATARRMPRVIRPRGAAINTGWY